MLLYIATDVLSVMEHVHYNMVILTGAKIALERQKKKTLRYIRIQSIYSARQVFIANSTTQLQLWFMSPFQSMYSSSMFILLCSYGYKDRINIALINGQ